MTLCEYFSLPFLARLEEAGWKVDESGYGYPHHVARIWVEGTYKTPRTVDLTVPLELGVSSPLRMCGFLSRVEVVRACARLGVVTPRNL